MPFKSKAQRRWMYANDPKMAAEWEAATPEVQFRKGDELAQGQASAANSLMGLIGTGQGPEPHQPANPEEQFLFSQSDRPNEPITHGAPFGPGANTVRGAFSSDADVVQQ